ncbi:hypothetical protein RhiirA4_551380 [Rhizophagus irregularis]|uniref:Uncharacterized protein n=1 Tax=Rhizophagus irregularis TaxID=588596 RepID=A0A2I1HW21_9GLOM|nr:hypothetical protein RhiirA4_551380 [Rhizophagus irregularis]
MLIFGYKIFSYSLFDDPNNPWKLAPSYNQIIDNNGNINSNPSMIQIPDKNTNMFMDIRTSLFAMYLFLAGDSSALSNWEYTENPSIAKLEKIIIESHI